MQVKGVRKCQKEYIEMKSNRIYDNGGKTYDRYTLIAADNSLYGFNESPCHPQGFGQYAGDWRGGSTRHLGKKIKASQLPEQAQRFVKDIAKQTAWVAAKDKVVVAKIPSYGTWGKRKTKKVRAKASKCR